MPLIVQSTKQHPTSFNLSIINSQMQIATKDTATLEETKGAIVNMYQNGTTQKLSSQAQKAAHALAQYIYANKGSKKFAFVLGKDHQDQQLLLLTISNNLAKSKVDVSLQKGIQPASINAQKQEDPLLVKQLSWVTEALYKVEFGILFWIYQHQLSSQEALLGTMLVPLPIIAVNFQRPKTAHEQLQAQAWAKMMQVIQNLTSRQLNIHGDDQQLPSQTKITTSDIVLAIQKIINHDDKISKAASKLMKVDNIEVQLVDKTGAMIITITNYGHDKIMTIFGFKATGTPLEVAQAKIDAAKDGATLPTKSNEVSYNKTPTALDANAPTKNGVMFRFKSATAVNNKGESRHTYEVDANPQVKGTTLKGVTFVVSGFETQAQARERIAISVAQAAIQNLIATDFATGIDKTKIASRGKPLKAHVIADIKKQISNRDAQALILPGDITITFDNTAQIVTIIIHNHGLIKTIIINEFSSIEDYLKLGSHAIKDYLDQLLRALPFAGGALEIPEGITSIQFDGYVQAMGNTLNEKGEFVMNKFGEQYRAKIISLTIPNSFTIIDPWFRHFNRITSLHIPNSVTKIANEAFAFFPLTTLSLGNKLQTIGIQAFASALLTSLIIPDSVTAIGTSAFVSSPLTTLSLGNKLQTIGDNVFFSARLTSLTIPNSVTAIGEYAFFSSSLTSVTIFRDVDLHIAAFKGRVTIQRIPR